MIVVTGGAGFIGSALVWRLDQLGRDDILIVDSLGTLDSTITCADVIKLRDAGYTGKQHSLNYTVYDCVVHYLHKSQHLGHEQDANR